MDDDIATGAAMPDEAAIVAALLALAAARGPGRTFCPSEAARLLVADETGWRAAMPAVRAVAAHLAEHGRLRVTRGGRPVDPLRARGPIRLGAPG